MTTWDLIFFSVVQGIGEFLPISSSGHLLLLKRVLHLESIPLFFDILLHVGTLFAIIIFFRSRIASLLKSVWNFLGRGLKLSQATEKREDQMLVLFILIVTLSTGITGILIKEIVGIWESSYWVSASFLVTAGFLIISHFFSKSQRGKERSTISIGKFGSLAIIVGIAQGIGILPGVSRSGITIAMLLILRFPRAKVAEVSFLASVPAVIGALFFGVKDIDFSSFFSLVSLPSLISAMVLTSVVGYTSLIVFCSLLFHMRLFYFSFYLILIALWGFFQ